MTIMTMFNLPLFSSTGADNLSVTSSFNSLPKYFMSKLTPPSILLKICHGYLVDATTVTECLHTFCKSCIVKHLEDSNTCPECDDLIHQSHPLDYIAFDRTMQV